VLAAPIVDLLRAIGSGQIPAGGPNAILSASAAAIETARTTARTAADQMGQHWASAAADTAADEAHTAQQRAQLIADNGNALAANLERAAADVQRGMLELAAILEHFVTEVGPWVPTLLTSPAGLVLILESAAAHLRQALVVVERTRTELEDRKRELRELMGERIDQEPTEQPAGPTETGTDPTGTGTQAATGPAVDIPQSSSSAPETGAPVQTGAAGGAAPTPDGLTPEEYRSRPLYPGGPTPDPTGQPGVTGPIPPAGQQPPARPTPQTPGPSATPSAPPSTTPAPGTSAPTTTPSAPPTAAPPPARLPDQPGVIGPAPEVPETPAPVDQPGVIGPPPQ
ncbi:hypothetical protein, partial [Nocardia flavorosea]